MEQDSVDDSFDANEYGSDEFDDSWFIVGSVYIFSADWLREAVIGQFVSFDETPIKAVDWGSTINEGLGDDVFIDGVFEDW